MEKKRNPTPATKSTATPQKLIIEIHQHWTDVFNNGLIFMMSMASLRCHVQSSTLHCERRHTSQSIRLALIIAYIIRRIGD